MISDDIYAEAHPKERKLVDPKTKLMICTPSYQAQVHIGYAGSLLRTGHMLWREGVTWVPKFYAGPAHPPVARGILTAQFLASDYTHMLFIDADLDWQPEAVGRLLMATEFLDAVCGVYPKKRTDLSFPVNFAMAEDCRPITDPNTGYIELKDACTGFLMLTRSALLRMVDAYPGRKCSFREDAPPEEERWEYNLFDCFVDSDGRYLSEDFGFTRLYQQIGGHIWADADILLGHFGAKKYTGSIAECLVFDEQPDRVA